MGLLGRVGLLLQPLQRARQLRQQVRVPHQRVVQPVHQHRQALRRVRVQQQPYDNSL